MEEEEEEVPMEEAMDETFADAEESLLYGFGIQGLGFRMWGFGMGFRV